MEELTSWDERQGPQDMGVQESVHGIKGIRKGQGEGLDEGDEDGKVRCSRGRVAPVVETLTAKVFE